MKVHYNKEDISYSLELLKAGNLSEAQTIFSDNLKNNYSDKIAESGLKCIKYWTPRLSKIDKIPNDYEKGKSLYDEWRKFETFIKTIKNIKKVVVDSFMYYIFSTILEVLHSDVEASKIVDLQSYLLIGISYKKIGDFKSAIRFFENTLKVDKNNSKAMALLADCYALIDEDRKAKVLFREAFFIDPLAIDIDVLDSNIIHRLETILLDLSVREEVIGVWLPVYARVFNIFNVKRELLPVELGKLKQQIFNLEEMCKANSYGDESLNALLLNHYLRLYDFLLTKVAVKDDGELKKTETKIKLISPDIYELLKNNS